MVATKSRCNNCPHLTGVQQLPNLVLSSAEHSDERKSAQGDMGDMNRLLEV